MGPAFVDCWRVLLPLILVIDFVLLVIDWNNFENIALLMEDIQVEEKDLFFFIP